MSQDGAIAKLARPPQLRGLLHSQIKKNLILVGISCFVAGVYMKYGFGVPRQEKYAEFYKNFDANKEFERMRKKGVFDSCDAD